MRQVVVLIVQYQGTLGIVVQRGEVLVEVRGLLGQHELAALRHVLAKGTHEVVDVQDIGLAKALNLGCDGPSSPLKKYTSLNMTIFNPIREKYKKLSL